ncbi:GNAT family N-acetyltransferase [Viridibacillus arvi]|uniref:GNAT family N-acetyltransferase n=1 Tax=Viridibacillus arvi TaxID=263475 RepID=UPI0036F12EE6
MMVTLSDDFQMNNIARMKEIYQSVGWKKHSEKVIEQIFSSSNHTVFAFINGELVGFARAISDGVFNAAIYDVVVHPDFQGQGIAKMIVDELLVQLKSISCIHMISTSGNEEFYKKCGFKKLKTGMARYLDVHLTEEYLT